MKGRKPCGKKPKEGEGRVVKLMIVDIVSRVLSSVILVFFGHH